MLTNSYIAAPQRHPVFTRILKVLPEVVASLPEAPAWWSTGPLIFTVISRGTSFSVPDATFVAGILPRKAPWSDVEALRKKAQSSDSGLLIGWKSW
jgi:mannosyltransferase OCH1-like enzyme